MGITPATQRRAADSTGAVRTVATVSSRREAGDGGADEFGADNVGGAEPVGDGI